MKVKALFISVIDIIYFATLSHAEIINFIPIDSIQITSTCVEARDITGDNIDEIFVGTDGGLYIYDGVTFDLIDADSSLPGPVGDIEIGDIEGDGLFDYFVAVHGDNRNISIYFNEDLLNKVIWPGYLNRDPYSLFFYSEADTSFLNFGTIGGNRLNLISWDYQYANLPYNLYSYYPLNDYLYDIYSYLGDYEGYIYMRKLSYDYAFFNSVLLFTFWYYESSFLYTFGNFRYPEDYECYLHSFNYQGGDPVELNLKMIGSDLSTILSAPRPEFTNPGIFKSFNFYGDHYDELAVDISDNNQRKLALFNGNADVCAESYVWPDLEYSYACEIDGDQYDEIAVQNNEYLIFYDTEITTVSILNDRNIPASFYLNAYPNPFNGQLNVVLKYAKYGYLDVCAYDILGREVDHIFRGPINTGDIILKWSPVKSELPSGVYFIGARHNNIFNSIKVLYLK